MSEATAMNEGAPVIPLKAFWDAVEQRLSEYSADELRAIVRGMAQETAPSGRQAFLDRLVRKPATEVRFKEALAQSDLLTDIDDWIAEVRADREQAQRWEERHDYDWGEHYDDEDTLGAYARFVEPLVMLFDRAEAVFAYGEVALARQAYHKLFTEALRQEDDYGRGVAAEDLSGMDAPQARARYLRAVYESEPAPRRAEVMFDQMTAARGWLFRRELTLAEVIAVTAQPLPGGEAFLRDWIALLRAQDSAIADVWLREAIRLDQGAAGLEVFARAEGLAHPLAFLDWLAALEAELRPRAVLEAAQFALEILPAGLVLRAQVADYLCRAAETLNEHEIVRAGRWEAFQAQPVLARLLDVWSVSQDRTAQTAAMQRAAQYLRSQITVVRTPPDGRATDAAIMGFRTWDRTDRGIIVHALLLAQDWAPVLQYAAEEEVTSWTFSGTAQGLVAPFLLMLLGRAPTGALPANVALIWREALENTALVGSWNSPQQIALVARLEQVYEELAARVALDPDQVRAYLALCEEIGRRRVDAIVSNLERGSYAHAATLVAACAEVLQIHGEAQDADLLLTQVRNKFPRHRAFQAEMKTAIARMRINRG